MGAAPPRRPPPPRHARDKRDKRDMPAAMEWGGAGGDLAGRRWARPKGRRRVLSAGEGVDNQVLRRKPLGAGLAGEVRVAAGKARPEAAAPGAHGGVGTIGAATRTAGGDFHLDPVEGAAPPQEALPDVLPESRFANLVAGSSARPVPHRTLLPVVCRRRRAGGSWITRASINENLLYIVTHLPENPFPKRREASFDSHKRSFDRRRVGGDGRDRGGTGRRCRENLLSGGL